MKTFKKKEIAFRLYPNVSGKQAEQNLSRMINRDQNLSHFMAGLGYRTDTDFFTEDQHEFLMKYLRKKEVFKKAS